MRGTVHFLLAAVLAIGFFGCSQNPNSVESDDSSLQTPIFSLLGSWQLNDSVWMYEMALAGRVFDPAVKDSVALIGFRADGKDWNNWRLGILGRKLDGVWIFNVATGNADKRINFVQGNKWAQVDSLKKTGFFYGSGDLGISFRDGNIAPLQQAARRDTLIIIKEIIGSDTVCDTLYHTDTIVVTKIVVKTDTLPGMIIYDTLRITNHDTIVTSDTSVITAKIIDGGTVADTSRDVSRDTSWLRTDHLTGVIIEDTVLNVRKIHLVWLITTAGDTVPRFDTTLTKIRTLQRQIDTISFVFSDLGVSTVGGSKLYRFGITEQAFAYTGRGDDSASLIGLNSSLWTFAGKINGYFVFDAKLQQGVIYNFNFLGNKGTWAQQEVLLLSPLAVKNGSNCDIVVRAGATGLEKP